MANLKDLVVNGNSSFVGKVRNNGDVETKGRTYVHTAVGTGGQAGYIKIAQIKILQQYQDVPIVMEILQRGKNYSSVLSIRYANSNSEDPALSQFHYNGALIFANLVKAATSTWDLYIQKSEAWDRICVVRFNMQSTGGTGVYWKDEQVATLPSGANQATIGESNMVVARAHSLLTPRSINGTSFDGSTNITTANWGTARNITIGSTTKSVNGSANVAWSLSEIGAATANHSHNYLPLSGGAMTGPIKVNLGGHNSVAIGLYAGDVNGVGMTIGAGGRTIIGSGESAESLRTALGTATTNESAEEMYVTGDGAVTIFTNCQTIANRKAFTFGADGTLTATRFTGTLNGSANGLALNPSNRQASANVDIKSTPYLNRITYMLATSTMTTGKPPHDGHILTFGWDNNGGWGAQLAIDVGTEFGNIYTRCARPNSNGTGFAWDTTWKTFLNSSNYNSYTPTKTGGGASGNWNINSATATKLATKRTIALSGDVTGSGTFDGSANLTIDAKLANSNFDFDTYSNMTGYAYTYNKSTKVETITHNGATFATRQTVKDSDGNYTITTTCTPLNFTSKKKWTKDASGNWSTADV